MHEAIPSTLRRVNIRSVFEVLRREGAQSRASLTRRTRVSAPTMSNLLADLLKQELIEEVTDTASGKGRPSKVFRLSGESVRVLGAVIGIEECQVLSCGLDGAIDPATIERFPTPGTYADLIDNVCTRLQAIRQSASARYLGLGISIPGLINQQESRIIVSPNLHITDGQTPGSDLSQRLDLPTVTIQEQNALCLAEQFTGPAKDVEDFALIDITAGMGMGIVSGGQFISGVSGYGGELGHIPVDLNGELCGCGHRGCLETIATDHALAKAVSKRVGMTLSVAQLIDKLQNNEFYAEEELNRTLDALSIGVTAVINIFNPAIIFIHGHFFDARPTLFEDLNQRVMARALSPAVRDCRLLRPQGNRALGAIVGIIDHLVDAIGPRLPNR